MSCKGIQVHYRLLSMSEVQDDIWGLLAKYLCGEASSTERLLVEILLKENEDLRNFYQQLEMAYLLNENKGNKDALYAFSKLDERIKKSNL